MSIPGPTKKNHAIDFEYSVNPDGSIDKLICCCMRSSEGCARFWLFDDKDTHRLVQILNIIKAAHETLVAHAVPYAEARCLLKLGLDPREFCWRDTCLEARLLDKTFTKGAVTHTYGLAAVLQRFLKVDVDCAEKARLQALCAAGVDIEDNKAQILDYCASDVEHMLPLANHLRDLHIQYVSECYKLGDVHQDGWEARLERFAHYTVCCMMIASKGLPIDTETAEYMRVNGKAAEERLITAFCETFPGTYTQDKHGKFHASMKKLRECLQEFIVAKNLDSWPLTDTGELSLDSKVLEDWKGDEKSFAGAYYRLKKNLQGLGGLLKDGDRSWLKNLRDSRLMYETLNPFGANTGRNQPQPSKGFVFGWAHYLHPILNPAEGKMLVEIDYHAQETALQASLTGDSSYREVYTARDTYLWVAQQLGMLTSSQYEEMRGHDEEWKKKYSHIRKPCKTFTLAYSYGAGIKKLAAAAGVSEEQAAAMKDRLDNEVFSESTEWKREVVDAIYNNDCYGLKLPDGYFSRTRVYRNEEDASYNAVINFPFQAYGAYILREVVQEFAKQNIPCIATVHDAVVLEVDEGDWDTIDRAIEIMSEVPSRLLSGDDILQCHRDQVAVWHHHTLQDILTLPRDELVEKVGNLVDWGDIEKFRGLFSM